MRPRHKKKGTQPQIHTDADRRLSARATSSYLPYSTLKLALTRFSWGGEGVEIRAHQKILAWANTIVDGCVDEANSLGIPAERFLRNLLPMLSEWTASLLIACLQHNPALRRKVSGLKLDLLLLNSGDNRLDLFKKLLASEPKACIPSDLVTFIRLSNYALDQAWIRWLKGHNDHNNIGRLLASSSNWDDRYGRITKILLTAGLPEERVSLLCVPELQKATVTEPTEVNSIPRLVWLVREGGSAPEIQRNAHRRQEQTPFQASWPLVLENLRTDKPDPAILRAFVETATANPKNARWANKQLQAVSQTSILAEWPLEGDNTWQPPPSTFTYIQRISLLYAGKLATVDYLNSLSASRLKSVISSLGTDNLVLMATSLWALEPEAQPDQIKANVAREILNIVIPVASAEQIPSLLVNRAHMKGRVRHTILERLRSFTPDEFALFITGSSILEDQWKHLPIALREEILDLWIRFEPKVKNDQTVSSGILVDAARWGNDHAALVHVLYGAQPLQAIPVLRLWLADKEQNVWRNFLKLLYRAGPFPEAAMLAIATDKRLLDALLRDAISCFSGTALKHIDLAVLFPYALKHRWLSYEIEACFSAEELARVHEPLKNTLKNYPRRWAAVELALAMGPRYSTSLYYLSTRRFAEKPGARFDRLYHSWSLPKRKGGTRLITAPKPFLKALQRSLLRTFFSDLPLHPAATGFRTGLSIADNARPHVGQPVVVNMDITGFFQNTHFPLVARAIENALPKYMSPETRRLVTDICCYDGVLPTGAPTSPAIANLVLRRADHSISKVAGRNQITYTRYADDLTFSGEEPLKILPFVRDVLDGLGYKLDKKKTNIFRKGRRQIVTGLVVNQKVSVPRLMRRKLRAAVHRATQKSVDLTWHKAPMTMAELEGRIAFTAIAHREEALGMLKALRDKKEAKSES